MGLAQIIKNVLFREMESVYRPAQVYDSAVGAYTIYVINGGLVLIKGIVGFADVAVAAATTLTMTIAGVAVDSGAAAITSVIGSVIVWPLDPTAAVAVIPNVLAGPNPTLAGVLLGTDSGVVAGPGDIVITAGVASTTPGTISWRCLYRRLDPWASITLI